MTKRNLMIGLGVSAALAAAIGTYGVTASAQDRPGYGYGPGMMDGYGPGNGNGYGPGYDHMRGYGPGYGHMRGYDRDDDQRQGYGPGNHMRGWDGEHGPGMMQGNGYGRGYGHGMMGW